jgi:hypothetical protein
MSGPPKPTKKHSRRDELPQLLYAVRGNQCQDTYFAYDTFERHDEGSTVGVYELREVRTLTVTRTLR